MYGLPCCGYNPCCCPPALFPGDVQIQGKTTFNGPIILTRRQDLTVSDSQSYNINEDTQLLNLTSTGPVSITLNGLESGRLVFVKNNNPTDSITIDVNGKITKFGAQEAEWVIG